MKRTNYRQPKHKGKASHKNVKKLLAIGKKQLKHKDHDGAAKTFEKAFFENKRNSECMSYYGLLSALRWGKIGLGINLCTQAIKTNTLNPEFYLNLGRVYVAAQNKKAAATVFRKGLKAAPSNKNLSNMLYTIGARKRPLIPILKWANPLNRNLAIFFKNTLPGMFRKKIPKKVKLRLEAKTSA